ncbi:MAG TPA: hypothetical protein H9671_11855 [Firmicutes bacterium]|nr:hypothetical protein [Bacillota bacterium]
MKKMISWIYVIAIITFVIDWGIVGLKLLDGNYDITAGAYIGLVCLFMIFVCVVYKAFHDKCPHCGKLRLSKGKYCSYCGKEITK